MYRTIVLLLVLLTTPTTLMIDVATVCHLWKEEKKQVPLPGFSKLYIVIRGTEYILIEHNGQVDIWRSLR